MHDNGVNDALVALNELPRSSSNSVGGKMTRMERKLLWTAWGVALAIPGAIAFGYGVFMLFR